MSCVVSYLAGVAAGLSGAEGATHLDKAHVRRDRAAARAFQRTCRPRQARDSGLLQTRPSPDGPGKENKGQRRRAEGPAAFGLFVCVFLWVVVFRSALLRLFFGVHVSIITVSYNMCKMFCFVSLLCIFLCWFLFVYSSSFCYVCFSVEVFSCGRRLSCLSARSTCCVSPFRFLFLFFGKKEEPKPPRTAV